MVAAVLTGLVLSFTSAVAMRLVTMTMTVLRVSIAMLSIAITIVSMMVVMVTPVLARGPMGISSMPISVTAGLTMVSNTKGGARTNTPMRSCATLLSMAVFRAVGRRFLLEAIRFHFWWRHGAAVLLPPHLSKGLLHSTRSQLVAGGKGRDPDRATGIRHRLRA